ncbi:TasA family protein [Halogeometricum luteum]|uniref:CalY family protein n=1 Tax=Halogeometricum luteum TaxID=2950537 RepID=A0ABU2FWA0_9EURY|nr:TasA family protein [Halogeometricum sp. S3BR5-2]MDS0292810.1 CalY family protein [Halogeometricum sp. S3BR5-2]
MADNNTNIKLSRRKILAGLGTIGLASAGAGAGTMALFSDSESVQADVQAGTLDLTVNGQNGVVTILDEEGIAPGDDGQEKITVKNAGTVAGLLTGSIDSVQDYENGRSEVESEKDGDSEGELSEYLEVHIPGNGWKTLSDLEGQSYPSYTLNGGEKLTIPIKWHLPVTAGNAVQSDRVTADMTLSLTQETDNPQGETGTGFPQTSYEKVFGSELKVSKGNYDLRLKDGGQSTADASFSAGGYASTYQSGESYDFELEIADDGETTLSSNGYSVTNTYSGSFTRLALIASSRENGATVTVEDLSIDGAAALPNTLESDSGREYVEFSDLDGSDGLTLTGTVTFEYTGDGNNGPVELLIDAAE